MRTTLTAVDHQAPVDTTTEFNASVLNDHDLLLEGVLDVVVENHASARRWARLVELHRRRPDTDGNFAMTAREWTALEVSEAWAVSDNHARHQLNVALFLSEHLPGVWKLCLQGALDRYRATTIADIARLRLDDPADWARLAERLAPFLSRHLRSYDDLGVALVTCTVTQLRNKLNYETRVLRPADDEFAKQLSDRAVRAHEFEDGMAQLSVTSSVDQVRLARHRLHLTAKELRSRGDERTIEQLMADVALDLIIGRAPDLPVPRYARPIVNVTVSLETIAGLRDDPGQLSGGAVIPADLARAIATSEGATWHRLLTDPIGGPVALSTKSYQPTDTIWRYVVATGPTCSHAGCDRPAVECELDHVVPWPLGPTSTDNLEPLCKRHHKAKHARAERPDLAWEHWAA